MSKIQILKNLSLNMQKTQSAYGEASGAGYLPDFQTEEVCAYLPISFIQDLLHEIEELEERCGEVSA
jgi:uncharacterized protein (DUF169 family)